MGISIWQLLIVLVIVLLLFGTKKLRNVGSDMGGAIKSFRSAMRDGEASKGGKPEKDSEPEKDGEPGKIQENSSGTVIDGEVTNKEQDKA